MNAGYVIKAGKRLRCGYTTGSCAAGAAKAAALMLHTGRTVKEVELDTPAGVRLRLTIQQPCIQEDCAICAIRKDAGDDPDITDGLLIFAEVSQRCDGNIVIDDGDGIGRITRKGFWGDVGEAAINPVPRRMIREALRQVAECGWNVRISAPGGRALARNTFNPRLGIEGGISILGTTGIVEPMSEEALKATIFLEIDQIRAAGSDDILLFLGNYGERFVQQQGWQTPRVKIANFIGEAALYCAESGFHRITLVGHIGKLCKLSIGAFNTHSKVCDARMEAFVYYLALAGAPHQLIRQVAQCTSSEDALTLLMTSAHTTIPEAMRQGCIQRLTRYVNHDAVEIDVIIYSMEYGIWQGEVEQ